ncbi:MAG: hypothetical protein ACPGQ5_06370 [Alphaproteobacteria bacterium]
MSDFTKTRSPGDACAARAAALDAGATVLLRKPLDLSELAAAFSENLPTG